MTKQNLIENFYQSPVTYFIIAIVFLVSISALFDRKLFYRLILHPQSVIRGRQYYRIITADLTNVDLGHLLLNELMLYVFCTHLEFALRSKSGYGSIQFLAIYLSSMLIASIIIVLKYYKKFDYSTTGTSGSIMGCMFSFMLLDPHYVVFDLPGIGKINNMVAGLFYIVILFLYQRRKNTGLTNNEFHFYGALGGIIATLVLYPNMVKFLGF